MTTCKNCGKPIIEAGGRWRHQASGGSPARMMLTMSCVRDGYFGPWPSTRAEPADEESEPVAVYAQASAREEE